MPLPSPITIWRLSPHLLAAVVGLPETRVSAAAQSLSAEERRRASAFHAEQDRRLYTSAHLALRLVLSRLLGQTPASIAITGEGGTKPRIADPSTLPAALCFNLAHTRRGVLIATAPGCEVGIDIEEHRPIEDVETLARTIMSPTERIAWQSLPPASHPSALYRLWTRKEAYLKAIGLGLFRDLQAVTVPILPLQLTEPVRVDDLGETLPSAHWHLCDLPVWEGYSAALCWQESDPRPGRKPHLAVHDLMLEDLFPE